MVSESIQLRASRVFSLDALRGLIIVFMALDHANHFIAQKHPPSEMWDGVYPIYYSALAFLTRLVTHLAAPGFFFLMGAGMLLFAISRQKAGWGRWAIVRHFLVRGALLMVLELLIVNRAWELSPEGWGLKVSFGVLFALGGTMMLGSLVLWLKPALLAGLAVLLLVGTELMHPGLGMWGQVSHAPLSVILFYPGGTSDLWAYYPILPWMELVVFGILFGRWLAEDPQEAFGRAWKLGAAFLLVFVVVRALDSFGNIRPRMSDSWIDFMNPVKYPPSMTYSLMTMGANLLLLWLLSRAGRVAQRALAPLATLGRAPLFFYVLHLFLYAGLGYLLTPHGASLPLLYPLWLLGLLILFPLCLWYGTFKARQPAHSALRLL